jgi:hypothetical protein
MPDRGWLGVGLRYSVLLFMEGGVIWSERGLGPVGCVTVRSKELR